jgi:hypothetical protein
MTLLAVSLSWWFDRQQLESRHYKELLKQQQTNHQLAMEADRWMERTYKLAQSVKSAK